VTLRALRDACHRRAGVSVLGMYQMLVEIPHSPSAAGRWLWRIEVDQPRGACEGFFTVRKSRFYAA
jgi:hypothetical protein